MKRILSCAEAALCSLFIIVNPVFAQSTTFTYQGQLNAGGGPASGNYDFTFGLFNTNSTNSGQVGGTVTNLDVGVANGLFTVLIDFGGVFTGSNYWLAISVQTNGGANFTALNPLQQLTPVPYAIYAPNAGFAASASSMAATNITGTISLGTLPAAVLTNGESGVTLSGDGGGLTNLHASAAQLTSIGNDNGGIFNFYVGPSGNSTTSGFENTANGVQALSQNTAGSYNTADGVQALSGNTTGSYNTANGIQALWQNTTGSYNTADGGYALWQNVNGNSNTAVGSLALFQSTDGNNNTAVGEGALGYLGFFASGGNNNIALGYQAGLYYDLGESSNIDIGNPGVFGENCTIHLGTPGIQTNTIIAGVINGNGGGLTNLIASQLTGVVPLAQLPSMPASNITGTISLAQLPAALVTNDTSSVTIGGTSQIAPLTVPPTVPPSAIGSAGTGNVPESVAVDGRYAYVVNGSPSTLQVYDVSTPSAPVSLGSVGTGTQPQAVAVAGRYAYVANVIGNTLQVFDVSNPTAPAGVGSVGTGSHPDSVAVAGRYAYVADFGASTLQVFDVSNPAAPVSVGSVGTGTGPGSVAVSGRYAYLVNSDVNQLQIIDVSDPTAPVSVGSVGTGNFPISLAVAGCYAYVVNSTDSTLQVFDVSNPSAPAGVGSVGTASEPGSVVVAGRYACVASFNGNTLQIFDVSKPSTPVSAGSVGTDSQPNSVAVAGRYAYVVNGGGNTLQIFDLGGAYIQQFEAGAIETGTLQTRDTVAVGNNLNVRGGLTVSASARISGGLSVDNGTITAMNFSGGGSALTSLNASQLTSGVVPSAALTSVPAASLTGTVPAADLPGGVALLNGTQAFTAVNTFNTNVVISNTAAPGNPLVTIVGNQAGGFGQATVSILNTNTGSTPAPALRVQANGNTTAGALSVSTQGTGLIAQFGSASAFVVDIKTTGTVDAVAFNTTSDRNAKEGFAPVNPPAVLDKVLALPITEWHFKTDIGTQHIGPMAQDFHAAFNIGTDEKHIATVDEDGVALAAIQGLNQKLEEQLKQKDADIQTLQQKNESLARRLNDLEAAVKALAETK